MNFVLCEHKDADFYNKDKCKWRENNFVGK